MSSAIPIDIHNPGHVFASLGFMEVAEVLCGPTLSEFDWSNPRQTRFRLSVPDGEDPFDRVLSFLAECEVVGVVPESSPDRLSMDKWKQAVVVQPHDQGFPMPLPESPATLPAQLRTDEHTVSLHHWGDATVRDNVKFWAGAGGLPGAAIASRTLELFRPQLPELREDPFSFRAPQSNSFRLDWRRDYVPSESGFSVNKHNHIVTLGHPIVELLAAVGLSNARPRRVSPRDKLRYAYTVPARRLPASLQRACLGARDTVFPHRSFLVHLDWPGKEG